MTGTARAERQSLRRDRHPELQLPLAPTAKSPAGSELSKPKSLDSLPALQNAVYVRQPGEEVTDGEGGWDADDTSRKNFASGGQERGRRAAEMITRTTG